MFAFKCLGARKVARSHSRLRVSSMTGVRSRVRQPRMVEHRRIIGGWDSPALGYLVAQLDNHGRGSSLGPHPTHPFAVTLPSLRKFVHYRFFHGDTARLQRTLPSIHPTLRPIPGNKIVQLTLIKSFILSHKASSIL